MPVRFLSVIVFCIILSNVVSGQSDTSRHKSDTAGSRIYLLQKVKRNGETLPEIEIKEVAVYGHSPVAPSRSDLRKYDRLVYNIKRVYPYALIVREKLYEVNNDLINLPEEKERKDYIRKLEKDVFAQYEDDIKEMSITQGKLLIKLIDRETANTSFELIKQYRGGLSAAFWQGIARIFGTNLKEEYDPYGQDILIEMIIQDIERGLL